MLTKEELRLNYGLLRVELADFGPQREGLLLVYRSEHKTGPFVSMRLAGKRPIHTSTAGRGPDQYMNSRPVQKHTSTTFLFKIHT